MKRVLVTFVVVALGLLLGGAVAGWPSNVKSDVVIEGVPSTEPVVETTEVVQVPIAPTTLRPIGTDGPIVTAAPTSPIAASTAGAESSLPSERTTPN